MDWYQQPSREDLDSETSISGVRTRFTRNLQSDSQSQLPRQLTKLERKFRWQRKEVAWDPNAVYVHHLAEFLRGETAVDSSCTNGDLLCFALHMIMMDSGYQPSVSLAWLLEQIVYSSSPWLSFAVGCCYCHTTHPRHLLMSLVHSCTHYLCVSLAVLSRVPHVIVQLLTTLYQLH